MIDIIFNTSEPVGSDSIEPGHNDGLVKPVAIIIAHFAHGGVKRHIFHGIYYLGISSIRSIVLILDLENCQLKVIVEVRFIEWRMFFLSCLIPMALINTRFGYNIQRHYKHAEIRPQK